jgi:excisionase family DNA binding protein
MNKNEIDMKNSALLSAKEASEYLSLSYRTLQNLIYERKIGFIKICRHYKFRKEDLDKFIEKNFIKPV